jgi:cysteine desulfurase
MFNFLKKNKRIYLDHAATTLMDMRVLEVMNNVYKNHYYNSSSWYADAVQTNRLIEQSRITVAKLLDTQSRNIFFCNGGTESNNLAVMGIIENYKKNNSEIPHVICSNIEHPAVLHTLQHLAGQGVIELDLLPVHENGVVDIQDLKKLLRPTTILVAIMYANNEIGTVQPIREIVKMVRWYRKQTGNTVYPLVHTDAIQATNYLDMSVVRLGVDSMSISGSKIYGPKNTAVLYLRNSSRCSPVMFGGDQEAGLRPGTLDPAGIVGFTEALQISKNLTQSESDRLIKIRDNFFQNITQKIPDVIINGDTENRLPNNINITIPGVSSEELVIRADAVGYNISSKSACSLDRDADDSQVINALRSAAGDTSDHISGNIRITMGRTTTPGDMDGFLMELIKIVKNIRKTRETLANY